MAYGALCQFASTGDKLINVDGVRSIRLVHRLELTGFPGGGFSHDVYLNGKQPGSEILVVPVLSAIGWSTGSGQGKYVTGCTFRGWQFLNDDNIRLNFESGQGQGRTYFIGNIYEVAPAQKGSGFGVFIDNGSNFTVINEQSHLGFITHKWEGWLDGTWTIPDWVPNRGTALVFANWDNQGVGMDFDAQNFSVRSINGGAQVRFMVVSTDFRPWRDGNFGIEIRDQNGNINLSNSHCPIHVPVMVNASSQWGGLPWGQDTMIALGRHGFFYDGPRPVRLFEGAMFMGGHQFKADKGNQFHFDSSAFFNFQGGVGVANVPVPCLQQSRYW